MSKHGFNVHVRKACTQLARTKLTDLTVVSFPAVATNALVHADFVDAGAAVTTGVTLTVINVCRKSRGRE